MKAAVLYGPRDIKVEEVPTPRPGTGEVILKVKACGICGSDLHDYKNFNYTELGEQVPGGRVLGHEFSGEIFELGVGVEGLNKGDRVVSIANGANAEFIRLSAMVRPLILPIPPELSFVEAATNEPLATSLHAVNLASPVEGETIVIMGAGLIGLGVLQILKALHKVKTVVIDVSDKRLEMAKKIGADVILNALRDDPYQKMQEMTGSMKIQYLDYLVPNVDTVFDCAGWSAEAKGSPPLWQALLMVKQNGKVIEVAVFEKPAEIDFNIIMRKNIYLTGSWGWNPLEFFYALDLLKSGKINRKHLITHTFPLDKAKEAYETQLNAHEAIKVVLIP